MEQPKYRLEDLNLKSDKEYLDIKEQLIGFLIDKDIDVPFSCLLYTSPSPRDCS